MLNGITGERELAYVVLIDDITPIEGYDRVELAHVGGWTVVVGKGEFIKGDPAFYFEIDSRLPDTKPFSDMEFLKKKKFIVKTQKMCSSISQGLLMSAENFGWMIEADLITTPDEQDIPILGIKDATGYIHHANDESRFLTQILNVVHVEPAVKKRKSHSNIDKYTRMKMIHANLFAKSSFIRWMYKDAWGKKILYKILGAKKKSNWPGWVHKTDEERIENIPQTLTFKEPWIVTEKIDGTSTTFTYRRGKTLDKDEFYVCSRNVVFTKEDQSCFYDTNVYLEMAEKYFIKPLMTELIYLYFPDCEWITIQGETYGNDIQKRGYSLTGHKFMAFNFITSKDGRWNTIRMKELLEDRLHLPCVPIIDEHFILPDTIEDLRAYVDSKPSAVDGELKEGIVCRSLDGVKSFM